MATAKTSSSTAMTRTTTKAPAASKAAKSTANAASPAASATPRPVPKATRSLAASFATLGEPRCLQVLGSLSNGLSATSSGLASILGMEAEAATSAITSLKRQGWVEGSRVEGSRNYTYKITEAGSATWGWAQGFIVA